eukprot:CAMPEP_0174837054 /NCGR_PEP_ID=MMETSP1114-20130205/6485_1 /TAXON_ID=312471 /ORGANISM="Neobodo designis, Strain CCAP 1951/1" /LENGTH=32 /DNA_ID= /DNA_START= /DNA_END= /DNA_ORIENTATION=
MYTHGANVVGPHAESVAVATGRAVDGPSAWDR